MAKYADKAEFVVTLGFIKNPALRIKLTGILSIKEVNLLPSLLPLHTSNHAEIGEGLLFFIKQPSMQEQKIGKGVIINTAANIEHDVVVGDYTHISTGVMVNGL